MVLQARGCRPPGLEEEEEGGDPGIRKPLPNLGLEDKREMGHFWRHLTPRLPPNLLESQPLCGAGTTATAGGTPDTAGTALFLPSDWAHLPGSSRRVTWKMCRRMGTRLNATR